MVEQARTAWFLPAALLLFAPDAIAANRERWREQPAICFHQRSPWRCFPLPPQLRDDKLLIASTSSMEFPYMTPHQGSQAPPFRAS